MTETEQIVTDKSREPRAPDFKSFDGFVAWSGITTNGNSYIKVVDSRTKKPVCFLLQNFDK